MNGCFISEAVSPGTLKWNQAIKRETDLYQRNTEIRTPFGRDYTRILHSMAYRRLKHKSQVYFSPTHDHISTRIDHVHYVASIGRIIADYLGLNAELTETIALGHDLGHPPFGHDGERVINNIVQDENIPYFGQQKTFWHGKSGLRQVDCFELLTGPDGKTHNLDLTYAVRDGIITHSGKVMQKPLFPRDDAIDLSQIETKGSVAPFTWEACIIKLADNISYLGRDIDDAKILGILTEEDDQTIAALVQHYAKAVRENAEDVNNANVIHLLVTDLCRNSSPEKGIGFSEEGYFVMSEIMIFNHQRIYNHPRLKAYKDYGEVMIRRIYDALAELTADYAGNYDRFLQTYPLLTQAFDSWIRKYWDQQRDPHIAGKIIFFTESDPNAFRCAAIDFISGMTDRFIERLYKEQISF